MSVDSKLFVTCGKDHLYEVIQSVTYNINTYVRNKLDSHIAEVGASSRMAFFWGDNYDSSKWTNGCDIGCYGFDCINIVFGVGEEIHRCLSILPDCSCDYSDTYRGDKIIFLLGCWGMYDEIMKVVAKAVAPFGDVYYDYNDCDDEGFVKL